MQECQKLQRLTRPSAINIPMDWISYVFVAVQ